MVKKSIGDATIEGDTKNNTEIVKKWTWQHTFDLIESEYSGWTDDIILDLTLERIYQIVDAISDRKVREFNLESQKQKITIKCLEISTKMICRYLVTLCPYVDPAGKNQIFQDINNFQLIKDEDLLEKPSEQEQNKTVYNKTEDLMNLHF